MMDHSQCIALSAPKLVVNTLLHAPFLSPKLDKCPHMVENICFNFQKYLLNIKSKFYYHN